MSSIAALALSAVLLSACGSADNAAGDSGPQPTSEARCGVAQADGSFTDVDCAEPHDGEFAGVVSGPGEVPEPVDVQGSDAAEVYTDFDLVRSCAEPVRDLIDGSLDTFGMDVAYVTDAEPGETYEDEIECWAWSRAEDVLTQSIGDRGVEEALGEHAEIGSLSVGDCFTFADPEGDSFDIVTPAGCDEGTNKVLGSVELDGDYPGPDAVSQDGGAGCVELAESSQVAADQTDVTFTYPTQRSWEALGQTTVICLAGPADTGQPTSVDDYCLTIPEGSTEGVEVDCDAPHNAQFVGQGNPPTKALPDDEAAAESVVSRICRSVAASTLGVDVLPEYLTMGKPPAAVAGATLEEPFDCYIAMSPDDVLTGSLIDTAPADVLGDYVAAIDLNPGDCFRLVEGSFYVVRSAQCSEADALMSIGSFQVPQDGDYPGVDALRDLRTQRCSKILSESGLEADATTLSGNMPSVVDWLAADIRTITCDAAPA